MEMEIQMQQVQEPTKHTPTPWELHARHIYAPDAKANIATVSSPRAGRFVGYHELHIGDPDFHEAHANAEFIVRAVNNHDALVEALQALEPYLSTEAQLLDAASLNEGRAGGFDVASVKARAALFAALASAKE